MKKIICAGAVFVAALFFASPSAFAQFKAPPAAVVGGSSTNLTIPWIIGGCVTSIIVSASVANWQDKRELTAPEAWSCGALYWFAPRNPPKKVRRRH
jgi:hypothetical protein